MNYCEHHLGDYAKNAGHLSMMEHGAYALLRDRYFTTEQPIPADQAHRLARAKSREERAAVDAVLAEFFTLIDGLYVNAGFDAAIEVAQGKIRAAQENGKRGGRPRKNQEQTDEKPSGFLLGSDSVTQPKAHQSPSTNKDISTPTESHPVAGAKPPAIPCPYEAIVAAYHEALPDLPSVRLMPKARQAAMRKLWGWVLSSRKSDGSRRAESPEQAIDWLRSYFVRAGQNDFLMGRGNRSGEHANWRADFDFLLTDKGMRHVIEKTQEAA